jgi:hypothetical protein
MFAFCKFKGIGIISYSPLMLGHLARPLGTETSRSKHTSTSPFAKKHRGSDKEIIKRVEELSERYSMKMCQVALAWSALKVSSMIVGANTVRVSFLGFVGALGAEVFLMQPERLRECFITGMTMSEDDVKYLEEL